MADERHNSFEVQIAVLQNELYNLKSIIKELKESNQTKTDKLEEVENRIEDAVAGVIKLVAKEYVTKIEWSPYKKILSGLVGFILLAAIGALFSLVFKKVSP